MRDLNVIKKFLLELIRDDIRVPVEIQAAVERLIKLEQVKARVS